jgi:hypothetical protein
VLLQTPPLISFDIEIAVASLLASAAARRAYNSCVTSTGRLSWSKRHTLVIIALAITWLLDGLGELGWTSRRHPETSGNTRPHGRPDRPGAVSAAIVFGYATDQLGHERLFSATLLLYRGHTAAPRFLAISSSPEQERRRVRPINPTVDELILARVPCRSLATTGRAVAFSACAGTGSELPVYNQSGSRTWQRYAPLNRPEPRLRFLRLSACDLKIARIPPGPITRLAGRMQQGHFEHT